MRGAERRGNLIPAFTGRQLDPETGLYYYRSRYYAPQAGRFTTADPIGLLGGPNLYAYVNNDPVNWIDPWGLSGGSSWVDEIADIVNDEAKDRIGQWFLNQAPGSVKESRRGMIIQFIYKMYGAVGTMGNFYALAMLAGTFVGTPLGLVFGFAAIGLLIYGVLDATFSLAEFLDGLRRLKEMQALSDAEYEFLSGLIEEYWEDHGFDDQGAGVPEPASWVLSICGIAFLWLVRRKKKFIDTAGTGF